jgi:hypothetical protein
MIDRAQSFYQDPSVKSFGNIFYDAPAKTTLGKLAPGLTTAGIAYLASGTLAEQAWTLMKSSP